MTQVLELLRELGTIDDRLASIQKARKEAPGFIAEAEALVTAAEARREQAKLDARSVIMKSDACTLDIKTLESQIEKYRSQQAGAKSNVEYDTFKKQISELRKQISDLETQAIEHMEASDHLKAEAAKFTEEAVAAKGPVDEARREIGLQEKDFLEEIGKLEKNRKAITKKVDTEVLQIYTRLHTRMGRRVMACADNSVCHVCGIRITVQDMQSLKSIAEEDIQQCRSCMRIMYLDQDALIRANS